MNLTAPTERAPSAKHRGWICIGPVRDPFLGTAIGTKWMRGRIVVISSLAIAELPDGAGTGPQWHISISHAGQRPSAKEVARALRAFGMEGAEEDNHHPGVARHFWRPVDPAHRVDCECKTTEDTIVEPDGYTWTNPKPGEGDCRGCEFATLTGKPCTVHA